MARRADTTRETRARNELLFREVNERIEQVSGGAQASEPLILLCECGHEECLEQIDVAPAEYEAVRAYGSRFIVVPGHEQTELERIVARAETYFVVEKIGAAAELAEQHDPRLAQP